MLAGTEPYPLASWANTFTRLRIDLEQALARERELAPAGRLTAEQARLDEANARFWETVERASKVRFPIAYVGPERKVDAIHNPS